MMDENDRRQPGVEPGRRRPDPGLTDLIRRDRALSSPMAGRINVGETGLESYELDTWDIEQGVNVLAEDGEKLGEVVGIYDGYMVVEQGFFDPRDIYVPISAIIRHDDAGLYLHYTIDEFEELDWSQRPDPAPGGDAAGEEAGA